ncbi:cation diffusion facilitator family transporter [Baia soyae]|uniref:Cation diffusion facilitator family transporter n=1 Tax=Baia soyae TaxID=1544746 RepID=A0A4R2RFE9_9BACL|nr:cation diffusion facilitator family transporter [Baia soyae]TCP60797.1 cation diffusion facilitator family transporter [Baia soyae]
MEEAQKGAWLSIGAYLLLAIVKLAVGLWAHSEAVSADGLNNVTDILLSIAILIGLKVSLQPADDDHHYGHKKAETVATLVAASFMVLVGLEVWIRAITAIGNPETIAIHPVALWISLLSAFLMLMVSLYNARLSKKTGSRALAAASKDNRSDAWVSIGAVVGIVGTWIGYPWLDAVSAVVIGFLIIRTGWEVAKPAILCLTDGVDQSSLQGMVDEVSQIDQVQKVIKFRARSHGSCYHIEVTIGVDPHLSVLKSHEVTEQVEEQLLKNKQIEYVHVHVEPVEYIEINSNIKDESALHYHV